MAQAATAFDPTCPSASADGAVTMGAAARHKQALIAMIPRQRRGVAGANIALLTEEAVLTSADARTRDQ